MGAIHILEADHKPLQLTKGQGEPGPKTLGLRSARDSIDKAGAYYADHASFTSLFFQRFLMESRALAADNPHEAKKRIMKHQFSPREKAEIREAILAFDYRLRSALMVRSDEYPRGLGLAYSGPASVTGGMGMSAAELDLLVERVEHRMKLVLASDFSPDFLAFKAKKGLTGNTGVLLMPAFGENEGNPDYILPIVSMNYLGPVDRTALVALGAGFGGANNEHAMSYVGSAVSFDRFFDNAELFGDTWQKLDLRRGEFANMGEDTEYLGTVARWRERYPEHWDEAVNEIVRVLTAAEGPIYLEMVKEDLLRPIWCVTQIAPAGVKSTVEPNSGTKSLQAKQVTGTALVSASKIHFVNFDKGIAAEAHSEYNERNDDGYVLVISTNYPRLFGRFWKPQHISNASAVVLHAPEYLEVEALFSHVGGWLRELGIPVLIGTLDHRLLASLARQPEQNLSCTVYADEFKQKGWLAVQ